MHTENQKPLNSGVRFGGFHFVMRPGTQSLADNNVGVARRLYPLLFQWEHTSRVLQKSIDFGVVWGFRVFPG